MALLDEACCGVSWIDGRNRFYVYPMQTVLTPILPMESTQQVDEMYFYEEILQRNVFRIILVQNAPEKPSATPPSPYFHRDSKQHMPTQVVTIAEYNQPSSVTNSNSQNDMQLCYVFENECKVR